MIKLTTPEQARRFVLERRFAGHTVGLVPTMGALHEGHRSLVRHACVQCDHTIATIFVNPTQFGPNEDLDKYPRLLEQDCQQLEAEGTTAVFLPSSDVIYPPGFSTYVEPPKVAAPLEGVCRPGHFRGVATVVMKLFQILPATHAFFGRKDYQQWKVIEAMVRDLNVGIEIACCDTVRESDGLALSSRNRYLSEEQRSRSLRLSVALRRAQQLADSGVRDVSRIEAEMRQILLSEGGVDAIDYARVVDAESLATLEHLDRPGVALIAAFVGQTRLIDNVSLS
ncbi:pantoate--beta-alanine ligase [Novipirellula artificiosorum]|uniref:Pantothenate synthetase n=1 Tax=Novipirellula artificiosorum TaxID=2528016 RepID=A0A5C6DX89_9BACT|nr:pantoate--beta-alanine ligase [Novipirellula artificiosorum]TWU40507.1 Pantoate-beta-alanine ligase [Novipirellula artificiosorum]